MVLYCLMEIPKKIKETVEVEETPIYDEFGVCIACKGGVEECLHTSLSDTNGKIVCLTCGQCMSCASE